MEWNDISVYADTVFQQARVDGDIVYSIWHGVVAGDGPEPSWYLRRNGPEDRWVRHDTIKSVEEARAMAEVLYRMGG